ncbi:hypothetical protein FB480_11263 [Agrobacterium vitis]|nr:hypothetical protein FB480_11263 [Agrobacterium vitis]
MSEADADGFIPEIGKGFRTYKADITCYSVLCVPHVVHAL